MKPLLLLLLSILLVGCSKNAHIARPYLYKYQYEGPALTTTVKKIQPDYYKNLLPPVQQYTITSDTVILGKYGTELKISLSCFGSDISELQLELIEVYSKKDMILSNRPTISNGKILESDGELFIRISHRGKSIQPICDEGVTITMATGKKENFTLFTGQVSASGNFNWTEDTLNLVMQNTNPSQPEYFLETDEISGGINSVSVSQVLSGENYLFQAKKLGWINCDRFYEDTSAKTDFYIVLDNEMPEPYFHRVYAVFNSLNAVIPLYSYDNKTFSVNGIPEGSEVTIVALGATDTKTFMAKKNIRVTPHLKTNMQLEARSKADIEKVLDEM